MKRSEMDKLSHEIAVLERKVAAYEKVRRAINELGERFKDDPYCLEALLSVDRTIFNQTLVIYRGLAKLREKMRRLQLEATGGPPR